MSKFQYISSSPKLPGEAVPSLNLVLYQTEQLPPTCLSFPIAHVPEGQEMICFERLKVQIFMQSHDFNSLGSMQTLKITSLKTKIQPCIINKK